jgi:GTP-binding protein HflX
LLLHLVDLANPLFEEQIHVVEKVLGEIGAGELPTVLVPNKVDVASAVSIHGLASNGALGICPISALTGAGVEELLNTVGHILDRGKEPFQASFTPAQGPLLALLREHGRIVREEYDGELIRITALVTSKLAGQMRKLLNGRSR